MKDFTIALVIVVMFCVFLSSVLGSYEDHRRGEQAADAIRDRAAELERHKAACEVDLRPGERCVLRYVKETK